MQKTVTMSWQYDMRSNLWNSNYSFPHKAYDHIPTQVFLFKFKRLTGFVRIKAEIKTHQSFRSGQLKQSCISCAGYFLLCCLFLALLFSSRDYKELFLQILFCPDEILLDFVSFYTFYTLSVQTQVPWSFSHSLQSTIHLLFERLVWNIWWQKKKMKYLFFPFY